MIKEFRFVWLGEKAGWLLMLAILILSAFPAPFLYATSVSEASIDYVSPVKSSYNTNEEIVLKVVRGSTLPQTGGVAVVLTSENGGEFRKGTLSGVCSDTWSSGSGNANISGDDSQKAFCYHNANVGPDTIMAVFTVGTSSETATLRLEIVAPVIDPVPELNIDICHATDSSNNPYVPQTVAAASILNGGHGNSGINSGDIIPPFPGFPGQNWDYAGQAIHANQCNPVVIDPDPVEFCTVTLVSDDTNTVVEKADAYAKLVSSLHSRWTAVVNAPSAWIWGDDPVADPIAETTYTFEKKFGWSGPITNATLTIAADNSYIGKINDAMAGFDSTEFNYQDTGVDVYDVTSLITQGNNLLSVAVKNWAMTDGTVERNPGGLKYELVVTGTDKDCDIPYEDPEDPVATIMAHKIVCTDEAELPNWGMGGPNITATTATDWVNAHSSCSLTNDFEFEWAPSNATNPDTGLPTTTFYGAAGGVWTMFGPTNASGTATVNLDATQIGSMSHVWMREVLKDEFIPFTYGPNNATNTNAVSAEMYCHTDVKNYDNYDRVDGIKVDNTYHCVAWNHPKEVEDPEDPPLTCESGVELVTNGSFENEIVTDISLWERFASVLGWNIATVSNGASTTLELHRGWSGNLAADGAQYAELDGDHSTVISQTIPTIAGETYTLDWDFAPRQLVTSEQNQLAVLVDDSLVAQNGPMVGTGTLAVTDWVPGSYTFVAMATSTKIAFRDEGPSDSFGTFLDDVSLHCVVNDDDDDDNDDNDDNDDDDENTTPPADDDDNGGSSSATRVGQRRVAGASTSDAPLGTGGDYPEIGAVLGEQISAMPYGAPNAGHGGADSSTLPFWSLALGLCFLALVRQFRHN